MGIARTNWRRFFALWLAATLLWAAAAAAFFPLRDAASAISRNAPNAAQQNAMFNTADKSFWFCMQQPLPPAKDSDIAPDQAKLAHCTSLKDFLYGEIVGMPRDWAWDHVENFAAAVFAGALGIAVLMVVVSRLARSRLARSPDDRA